MADKSLEVKITADVSSLQSQAAVAKVELSGLNASVKSLATAFIEASDDMKASIAPQLDVMTQKAAAAKAELASLNTEIKDTNHPEVVGFFNNLSESVRVSGESLENLHAKLSIFSQAASSLGELVIAGLALDQVVEKINEVSEAGVNLEKLSQETGLTTEQLSGLRVMAAETGTDFDSFTKMLMKMPGTMQSAATDPAGKVGEAFASMGVRVTNAETGALRPLGDVLDEVSAKLASYAEGTDKTALETDIFGNKINATLIPMLNQLGQVGLQGAIEKSNNLNQTWTGASAEAAEQYEQDMGRAKQAVDGITDSIVRGLLPALDAVANAMAPTLDTQISNLQGQIGELGVRAGAGMKQQLADLEAQKNAIDASIAQQKATAGGATPGSIAAPAPSVGGAADWIKTQDTALDEQNQKIEQNASTLKEANAEKLQNTVQFWQNVLATGDLSDKQELQAQDALAKAEIAQKGNSLAAGTSAVKAAQTDQTEIAAAASQARKEITISEYTVQVAQWDAEVSEKKITKAKEIQNEIDAENQIYATELATAEKVEALAVDGTVAKAKALDDVLVLTAAHNAQIAQLNATLVSQQVEDAQKVADMQTAAAAKTALAWQNAFAPIDQAFSSSINGILQGTLTLQNAEAKAAQSIALSFIDAEGKKVMVYAAGEAQILARVVATEFGMTAASTAGNVSRVTSKTAADAAGKAEDVALGTAQINSSAMKAAAGAYSAVAGIPIVGPVLAPAAAATAYAGVMAFDVLSAEGGTVIPAGINPLVQLHEREMVLPAHIARPLQSMIAGDTMNNAGDTNVTNHFNLTAQGGGGGGAPSAHDMLSTLNDAVRSGRLQKYPALARMMRRGG